MPPAAGDAVERLCVLQDLRASHSFFAGRAMKRPDKARPTQLVNVIHQTNSRTGSCLAKKVIGTEQPMVLVASARAFAPPACRGAPTMRVSGVCADDVFP